MVSSLKAMLLFAAGVGGAAVLSPLCIAGLQTAGAQSVQVAPQAPDTATVRLHISKMTCGSCPTTARPPFKRRAGGDSATLTLPDRLRGGSDHPRPGHT